MCTHVNVYVDMIRCVYMYNYFYEYMHINMAHLLNPTSQPPIPATAARSATISCLGPPKAPSNLRDVPREPIRAEYPAIWVSIHTPNLKKKHVPPEDDQTIPICQCLDLLLCVPQGRWHVPRPSRCDASKVEILQQSQKTQGVSRMVDINICI